MWGAASTVCALSCSSSGEPLACPPAHYQCPGHGLCLPVLTRCNGVHDCPGREDEAGCAQYTCPGLYRCRASLVCLTPAELCDGVPHCPKRDDEQACSIVCPASCTCYGRAFYCRSALSAAELDELRFLHADGSGLGLGEVGASSMLVYLSLGRCGLESLSALHLPNLRELRLHDNRLTQVGLHHLARLPQLRHLSLAGNPLAALFQGPPRTHDLLNSLDLARVRLPTFSLATLHVFPALQRLNLQDCGTDDLATGGKALPEFLRDLDVRGCPLTHFPADLLRGLRVLRHVQADNYRLCCRVTLPPSFNPLACRAPSDEVSSCENLLRSHLYRVALSLIATLALIGNLTVFVTRLFFGKVRNGFDVCIVTLCVSDWLMGLYLAVIGVADRVYYDSYLWNDETWRRSAACKVAGFLCMVSNEVSALTVCLITLDRLLVVRFPFSRVRFGRRSGVLAAAGVWAAGVTLAAVPLLPQTRHWAFYSHNAICMPLPITRRDFAGHKYAFSLLIILNMVIFILIAVGQLLIYQSVQKNSLKTAEGLAQRSCRDQRLARRLFTIALSDFLCWFPIGLLGILSSRNWPISGEVNVAMAIFVLPVNSALDLSSTPSTR